MQTHRTTILRDLRLPTRQNVGSLAVPCIIRNALLAARLQAWTQKRCSGALQAAYCQHPSVAYRFSLARNRSERHHRERDYWRYHVPFVRLNFALRIARARLKSVKLFFFMCLSTLTRTLANGHTRRRVSVTQDYCDFLDIVDVPSSLLLLRQLPRSI